MTLDSRWRMILVAFLLAVPGGAMAQDAKPARTGLEISPFMGGFNDSPEIGPDAFFADPAGNPLFGGYLAYHFGRHFFVEAEGAYTLMKLAGTFGRTHDMDTYLWGGSVGYNLPLADKFDIFGSVGSGLAVWHPVDVDSERDLMFRYDAGARYFFTDHIALRGDVSLHQVPDALGSLARAVSGINMSKQTFWGWGFSGGVSIFLGGKHDADGDGVTDDADACPGTPRGATVDARGCELDADRDGVVDRLDKCPNTPAGATVDATGCPTDSDGDGVFDGIDRCPNTPAGATVDASGCPSDSDSDGVFDGIDRCPNTPAGATVDATGCPSDSDRDGVFDGIDRCPDTAAGSKVDAVGCPVSEVQKALEQEGTYTFGDVNFAFDSAELRPGAATSLQEVGRVLTARSGDRMELVGFTDSVGSDAYNQKLSQRRAEAVRTYLVKNFPGLNASRFDVRGMGEAQPVADNSSAEGQSQNRRVEIRLLR